MRCPSSASPADDAALASPALSASPTSRGRPRSPDKGADRAVGSPLVASRSNMAHTLRTQRGDARGPGCRPRDKRP
ncbi:hypothetical protein IscW_ISCW011635 [Ixodes scapularis]|uniref:Uncharacterized protein n=1 Tax=Ixodes scapularis TaxID=6945 RepID=B7Q6D6_IXOSC|nr:hypothetical protein IscW_ISCW011635 [Ixodes scapularis]|eukprot:XP_002411943.1 hypothetical protein IscW_ISCW011635 [Ixodes scapularis]